MSKLRKVRNFIAERDRLDPKRNSTFGYLTEQLTLIPDMASLLQAKQLVREAEHVPAPEEWYYLAFGLLLAAAQNSGKVPVDYTFGLVDSILYDEELHRGYDEMGFSFAVVAQAIREVRRECKYVPSAQEVLDACDKHRRAFRQLGVALDLMIRVGEHAELMIKAAKPRKPRVDDDDEDLPF